MKHFLLIAVLSLSLASCKKKQNDSQDQTNNNTNNNPTPTATCCLAPFVATNTVSSNPDSIYTKIGNGGGAAKWEKWYVIITNGTNSDTLWTNGYEAYKNNPSNNTNSCLIFREFGNILGFISESNIYFKGADFAIYLPLDSNQVLNFPKGKYGFEKSYGASFSNDIGPKCKGSIHLQYAVNNELYRSLPQNSTSTYYNEVQKITFLKFNNANKIYAVKGVAKILMENQVNLTTSIVNLKYQILVQYNS